MTALPSTASRPAPPSTGGRGLLAELGRDRLAAVAALALLGLVAAAILAPWVAPHDPAAQDLRARLDPPFWLEGGSLLHPFGTDNLGRDVLSRILWGARTSLSIALAAVGAAAACGVVAGAVAGLSGGWVDSVVMRVVDVQMSLPDVLLALTVLAVVGPSPLTLVLIMAVGGWMVWARVTRSLVVASRHLGYVEAAELLGASRRHVVLRHVLPNVGAPLLPLLIVEFARMVLIESSLSFLGLGIQPPAVSWGLDVAAGKDHVFGAWWLVTLPGLAIALTILSANLLSGFVETTLDPVARDRRLLRALGPLAGRGGPP